MSTCGLDGNWSEPEDLKCLATQKHLLSLPHLPGLSVGPRSRPLLLTLALSPCAWGSPSPLRGMCRCGTSNINITGCRKVWLNPKTLARLWVHI